MPPLFEANAIVLVKPPQSPRGQPIVASPTRQEQAVNSQARLLTSEDVIRTALRDLPLERIFPELQSTKQNFYDQLIEAFRDSLVRWDLIQRAAAPASAHQSVGGLPPVDRAVQLATKGIRVRVENGTDLIKVSFRSPEPALSADFVNALVASLIEKHLSLYMNSEAVPFFIQQKKKQDQIFEAATIALSQFAAAHQMYSVDEQRKLALTRRSELLTALSTTRSSIVEKEAQEKTIVAQLARLKPLAKYPEVARLAKDATPVERQPAKPDREGQSRIPNDAISDNPPLLLIKVYQDTVQMLVKFKYELSGARALEEQQKVELAKIDEELKSMSRNEAAFEKLKLEVWRARQSMEVYSKLAADGQLDSSFVEGKVSSLEVAQRATRSRVPVVPDAKFILPIAGVLGLALGVLLAALKATVNGNLNRQVQPPPLSVRREAIAAFGRSTPSQTAVG